MAHFNFCSAVIDFFVQKEQTNRAQESSMSSSLHAHSNTHGFLYYVLWLRGLVAPLCWATGDSLSSGMEQAGKPMKTRSGGGLLPVPSCCSSPPYAQLESQCLLRNSLRKRNDGVIEMGGEALGEIGLESDKTEINTEGVLHESRSSSWRTKNE